MKLVCDEMLAGLGRWLRAAGHDTVIAADGTCDRALVVLAQAEKRLLLTRDRHLAEVAQPRAEAFLLAPETIDAQAQALRQALGLDWLLAPFTRCMLDNAPLCSAGSEHATAIPEGARGAAEPLRVCPLCGRLYWPGSHVRQMTACLRGWADTASK